MKIPRIMSTQHPDNVSLPFFAESHPIGGEDEIKEAYYAYSHLKCDEQMWDSEGKEVDEFVVKKLFSKYEPFFKATPLGKEVFLTLRVPNPQVEKAEGKILLEVLESIPRSFDIARIFYGRDVAPIFEIILPMTTSAQELNRIKEYYDQFISSKGDYTFTDRTKLKDWIGGFQPETINVIPLVEDKPYILNVDRIIEEYLRDKKVEYQRVFLARSDPAENYGMTAAVLMIKIALQKLHRLEQKLKIPLYPIVGVGSCPFRGNFKPTNVENCLTGYPSVQTFTVQSAFKYDYPVTTVVEAIDKVRATPRKEPIPVESEQKIAALIDKISSAYQRQLRLVAPLVNSLAPFIPSRRLRKLHIGLFGYSRAAGKITLPRAIVFCAALYSIGLPPELLGLSELSLKDIALIKKAYPDFYEDLRDALTYFNSDALLLIPELKSEIDQTISRLQIQSCVENEHREITGKIIRLLREKHFGEINELVLQAAWRRRFLG